MICRRKSTLEFLKTALNLMHHVRSHQSGRQTQKFTNKLAHIQGEILFGINPVLMALEAKNRTFHQIYYNPGSQRTTEIVNLATSMNVSCIQVARQSLNHLSSRSTSDFEVHQGVCADVTPLRQTIISDHQKVLDELHPESPQLWLLLCGISDAHNLGAIIRSAYFLGVQRVLCCSFKTGSAPVTPNVSKSSAGVVEIFPPHIVRDPESFLETLSMKDDWTIVSSGVPNVQTNARTSGGVVLVNKDGNQSEQFSRNVLLLVGNEGRGVPRELCEFSDLIAAVRPHNPIKSRVDSLNVSVATAILIQFFKQFENKE